LWQAFSVLVRGFRGKSSFPDFCGRIVHSETDPPRPLTDTDRYVLRHEDSIVEPVSARITLFQRGGLMWFLTRLGMIFLILTILAFKQCPENSSPPVLVGNDNRTPAGQFTNGVLNLKLELRNARWYPEDEKAGYRDVCAFAEQGQPPQSSGPLIRVAQGTKIHATVRNMLPSPAKIYGLHHHPGDPGDAVSLATNETRELQFLAGEPGTYMY
jgi:hypothetical protein